MACFKPLEAWQSSEKHHISGRRMPTFKAAEARMDLPRMKLPCGQCFGCRGDRARDMTVRLTHESKLHAFSWFVTFTYDDQHLPRDRGLHIEHVQGLHKRLRARRAGERIRFFCAGEYGPDTLRPHWHDLLFGLRLDDLRPIAGKAGEFTSKFLSDVWGMGNVHVGSVTPDSISYCAQYTIDKRTGQLAESHYRRIDPDTGEVYQVAPERALMSNRPGIGAGAFERWKGEFTSSDFVALKGGGKAPVPAYYDKLLTRENPEFMETIKLARIERASDPKAVANSTAERLAVREEVARARRGVYLKRTL